MRLVIAGGSGFIGSALVEPLLERGHALALLSRRPPRAGRSPREQWVGWQAQAGGDWEGVVDGADGVINLAGEPIVEKRWTEAQKGIIRLSRLSPTRALVGAIAKAKAKPKFLINGSATGYYGPRGDEALTEEDGAGEDFLARVCVDWEEEAKKAESHGLRVVRLRTGIVLGKGQGALAKMVPPFKLFVGGPPGTGKQWMSWIHIEDEVGLILFLAENPNAHGAFNATAPHPVTMKEFCQNLGQALHRPSWAPVPAFALRLLMGEMADMLLTGQRVLPARAEQLGYRFKYPTLLEALESLAL